MVGSTPKPLSSLAQVLYYSLRAQMSSGPYRALWVFGTTLSMQKKSWNQRQLAQYTEHFVNTDKWYCEAFLLGALPKPSGHSHGQPAWAGGWTRWSLVAPEVPSNLNHAVILCVSFAGSKPCPCWLWHWCCSKVGISKSLASSGVHPFQFGIWTSQPVLETLQIAKHCWGVEHWLSVY